MFSFKLSQKLQIRKVPNYYSYEFFNHYLKIQAHKKRKEKKKETFINAFRASSSIGQIPGAN